jgi:uncharacterized membrane protein
MKQVKSRVQQFDTIRGVAIVIMIWANSFPYLAEFKPHPYFRLLMSLAAPLFVFLSGITSFYRSSNKSNAVIAYLAVLSVAMIIDFGIWGILPFYTFDVLYLIAFGGLFQLLFYNDVKLHFLLFILCVLIYYLVSRFVDYRFNIPEVTISDSVEFSILNSCKRFFIDGWFPFLPWISFFFLGRAYAIKFQYFNHFLNSYKKEITIIFLVIFFYVATYFQFNDLRLGYMEVFYPVKIYFIVLATAWILLQVAYSISLNISLLSLIGKFSLTIYIFHAIVTKFIFNGLDQKYSLLGFTLISFLQLVIFIILASFLDRFIKTNIYNKIPYFIKKFFGI